MSHLIPTIYKVLILTIFPLLLAVQPLSAQMFSVDESKESRRRPASSAFYVGLEPATFSLDTDALQNLTPNTTRFDFEDPIFRVRYETPFLQLSLGLGNRVTGLDSVSFFNLALQVQRPLNVFLNNRFFLRIPIQLQTDLTSAGVQDATVGTDQFQQTLVGIGTGLALGYRFGSRFRVVADAIPGYGISFSLGNTFVGSVADLETGARLYFDRLFGDIGLSAGYDYYWRRYNVDGSRFDYTYAANRVIIGITF